MTFKRRHVDMRFRPVSAAPRPPLPRDPTGCGPQCDGNQTRGCKHQQRKRRRFRNQKNHGKPERIAESSHRFRSVEFIPHVWLLCEKWKRGSSGMNSTLRLPFQHAAGAEPKSSGFLVQRFPRDLDRRYHFRAIRSTRLIQPFLKSLYVVCEKSACAQPYRVVRRADCRSAFRIDRKTPQ